MFWRTRRNPSVTSLFRGCTENTSEMNAAAMIWVCALTFRGGRLRGSRAIAVWPLGVRELWGVGVGCTIGRETLSCHLREREKIGAARNSFYNAGAFKENESAMRAFVLAEGFIVGIVSWCLWLSAGWGTVGWLP